MGQQDFYKKVTAKAKKGQAPSDQERLAVDALMEMDARINSYKSELASINDHANWLKRQIEILEAQKADILGKF